MTVHDLAGALRKALPAPLFASLRSLTTATLTPIGFSWATGHFRSSIVNRATDKRGQPIPWYTYPTTQFLAAKSFSGKRILEWGAGQSTLWWSARADSVVSLENDSGWYRHLKPLVPRNVKLILVDDDIRTATADLADGSFDLIIVDGLDRYKAATESERLVSENGAIVLDNSEGYWGRDGEYPILDFFRGLNFYRIDFYGYAPGVIKPHCTSIFYKSSCFLLTGLENPKRDGQ